MAYINKEVSTMAMPSGMNRMGQFPLDMSSVYYDLESLQAYAASGAVAYVGQILSLVDEAKGNVTLYAIKNTAGDLVEIAADIAIPEVPEYTGEGAINVADHKISVVVDNETIKIVDGKLTAIIPEVEIPEFVDTNTTYGFAFNKETQKLTVTPSEGEAVELDLSDFLIASELPEDKNTEYHLEYSADDKAIKLVAGADANKMSIDATPFIKDGMLSDVEYDATSNTLTFVWNTDSGLQADTVVLSDILDPYTAGDKIVIDGSRISHATIDAPALVEGGNGRTYITELVSDGFGHITGYKVATESVVDTNDTYISGDGIEIRDEEDSIHSVNIKLADGESHLKITENGALAFDASGIDTDTNTTYEISANNATITLTPSEGEAQTVTLDVYTKGQTDQAIADKINEVNGGESAGEVLSNLNAYKKNIDTEIWGSEKVAEWTGEDGKYNPDYTETSRIDDLITSVTNLEEALNDKINKDDVSAQFEWVDNKLTIKSIDVAVVANLENLLNEKADKTTVDSLSELVNEIDGKVTDLTTALDDYVLKSDYQGVESDVAQLKQAMTWGSME